VGNNNFMAKVSSLFRYCVHIFQAAKLSRILSLFPERVQFLRTAKISKVLSLFPDRIQIFRTAKMKTELYYNLVFVACSDGLLHEKEIEMLMHEAPGCGISHDVALNLMTFSDEISYFPPQSEAEAKLFLSKLVKIAMADGHLSVREIEIITTKRIELNLSKTYLDALIQSYDYLLLQKKQA
jgi:hypothetical protein